MRFSGYFRMYVCVYPLLMPLLFLLLCFYCSICLTFNDCFDLLVVSYAVVGLRHEAIVMFISSTENYNQLKTFNANTLMINLFVRIFSCCIYIMCKSHIAYSVFCAEKKRTLYKPPPIIIHLWLLLLLLLLLCCGKKTKKKEKRNASSVAVFLSSRVMYVCWVFYVLLFFFILSTLATLPFRSLYLSISLLSLYCSLTLAFLIYTLRSACTQIVVTRWFCMFEISADKHKISRIRHALACSTLSSSPQIILQISYIQQTICLCLRECE